MASSLDQTLSALADPARLSVVRLLRKKPLRSSELADALSLTRPTMSRHLQVLRKSGIISVVDEGVDDNDARVRMYQLQPKPFAELRSFVDEVESFWTGQLSAFKAHAERKHGRTK